MFATGSEQASDDLTGDPVGPKVHRRLQSLSGQLSLNVGHREGWSYLTAGAGPAFFDTYIDPNLPDAPSQMATNFGFGARWFNGPHVAFTIDLRFYSLPPSTLILSSGARERQTLTFISLGISLK